MHRTAESSTFGLRAPPRCSWPRCTRDDGHVKAVRAALDGASEIIVISGFATLSGFKIISSEIKNCLDAGGRVTLVLGVDQAGITSADLVTLLERGELQPI